MRINDARHLLARPPVFQKTAKTAKTVDKPLKNGAKTDRRCGARYCCISALGTVEITAMQCRFAIRDLLN
jgi:hypothetical protein